MWSLLKRLTPANIVWNIARRRRALAFGILILRGKTIAIPEQIKLNKNYIRISSIPDHGARVDFVSILFDDMYMLDVVQSLRDIKTIVDIGANQGFFVIAARKWFPDALIHAYEPNTALSKVLETNAAAVGAKVFWEAVGSSPGTVELELFHSTNLTRAYRSERGKFPLTSLAQVVERIGGAIDLLKLDCEGWEWEILDSAASGAVRIVTMEYHLAGTGLSHDDVGPWLNRRGFKLLKQRCCTDFGQVLAIRSAQ